MSSSYRAVCSSTEISGEIVSLIEQYEPARLHDADRETAVRAVNNILQGRARDTPALLFAELERMAGEHDTERLSAVRQKMWDFQEQKAMLAQPYTRTSDKKYKFPTRHFNFCGSRKVINQYLYGCAVKSGFPPDFFSGSYFEGVTFYCLPDGADFSRSRFKDCIFAVCRLVGSNFKNTVFYDSTFHSCTMERADFEWGNIVRIQFQDCTMQSVSFQNTLLLHCTTTECVMNTTNFQEAELVGSTYSGISASGTVNLSNAEIAVDGATEEEAHHLAAATFRELGVPMFPEQKIKSRTGTKKNKQISR